jgi:GDP-mannose 6-dehydrogenase
VNISIFGMGYVGAVCIGCFGQLGNKVIGVDVNPLKVNMINDGKAPVIEKDLTEYIQNGLKQDLISATINIEYAVLNSDVSMICVGTPSKISGDLELKYVESVCKDIALALSQKDTYHTIIIRSTVLPGTCRDLVVPTLEEFSGKKLGEDFGLVMNPEFLRESTAINDFHYPPMIVIGEHDKKSGDVVEELYSGVNAKVIRCNVEVAELIKYSCNVWHATKVSFANEIGSIAKAVGVDGREVMEVLCEDTKLNISPYYMKPAYSFGGSCLPKDVRALSYRAASLDIDAPLIRSLLASNRTQFDRGFDLINQFGKKKVALMGLSFKSGTDDLRESPLVDLAEKLLGKGYDISIFDRNIEIAKVSGSNKEYINEHIPHISSLLNNNFEEVVEAAEIIVIGNGDEQFYSLLSELQKGKIVVDLYGIMNEKSCEQYQGICW